ncbi:Ig-like domain-containing protein, partial [Vibrio sp. ZSDE26]
MGIGTFINGSNLAAGQIVVVDINGNLKVLGEGEQPLPGEVLIKSDGSLEEQPQQPLQVEIVGENGENQDISAEIEDIFAALEEGQDPTQLGEEFATAAGGNSGSSLTSSASLERDGSETIAKTDFDTQGLEALGLSQTQSLTLLQQFRQFAPTFVDATGTDQGDSLAVTTDEDTPISGQFTATDSNGDSLVYAQTEAPTNGIVTVNPDGSWEYTPNENYNGPDSFTVEVTDGQGGVDTLVVEIGVNPVNDLPVAEDATTITEENTVLEGQVPAATDVDGNLDEEGYTLVEGLGDGNGSLVFNKDGSYTFTPGTDFDALPEGESREVTFTYTASDDLDAVSEAKTITIEVTGTNDLPVANVDTGSVDENNSVTVDVLAN